MNNDTLNALILRHGDNLLRRSGWLTVRSSGCLMRRSG